jgi:polysaccharide biosynthesis protein PslG
MRRCLPVIIALLLCALAAPSAHAKLPAGFMGAMLDGPGVDGTVDLEGQLADMRRDGVQTVRTVFSWRDAQPYASWDQVPPDQRPRYTDVGGVPTDFTATDRIAAAVHAAKLRLLPVIVYAPDWAAVHPGSLSSPPTNAAAYAAYVKAVVARYGRGGTRAITSVQIWNEPNLRTFWSDDGWAKPYAALLKAAHRAARQADRRVTVVLGAMTNGGRSTAWEAIRELYRQGVRRSFEQASVHPYTGTARNVVRTLDRVRAEMRKRGDGRKTLLVTELAFSSSDGDTRDTYATWDTTERGQAKRLTDSYRALIRARKRLRIGGVHWYTWLSPQVSRGQWMEYAGLRRMQDGKVVDKPALRAYARIAARYAR